MKSDFMERAEKIIAEIRTRTYIDKIDVEFIKDILQEELIKYHNEVFTYGYDIGFEDGRAEAESDNEAYTQEAVESAYDEGFALGYSDGCYDGYSEGYSEGHSEVRALISRSI